MEILEFTRHPFTGLINHQWTASRNITIHIEWLLKHFIQEGKDAILPAREYSTIWFSGRHNPDQWITICCKDREFHAHCNDVIVLEEFIQWLEMASHLPKQLDINQQLTKDYLDLDFE